MIGLDEHVFRVWYAGDAANGVAMKAMIAATLLGSGWSMLALVPLLVHARTRRFAASLTATLVTTAAIVALMKLLVRRNRPFMSLDGVHALFGSPMDFSFPSGHSAGSFAVAGFVAVAAARRAQAEPELARPLLAVSAAVGILATCVAFSRVYLGVHFPGDVAGGAALGATLGVIGARASRTSHERLLASRTQDDTQ